MTDAQIISISITVLAILAGSLFGDVNARFNDVNRRIDDSAAVLRAEMSLQFERTNNKIDALLKLVVDTDQRFTALESQVKRRYI